MSSKKVASRGSEQFMLRLPDGMRDRIKNSADENGRSMNAEIIHRLEQTFAASHVEPDDASSSSAHQIAVRVAEALAKLPEFTELARGLDRIRKEKKREL